MSNRAGKFQVGMIRTSGSKWRRLSTFVGMLMIMGAWSISSRAETSKLRIIVVSSYHREYLWSQGTNRGFCDAMLKLGYFDTQKQVEEYTKNDYVESSRVIVKKLWMDTKRNSSRSKMAEAATEITRIAKAFQPDLLFLGDDNAANYIGNQFLDTEIPIVFWGINNTPVKYGLVDSLEHPGHNATGIYQSGYYVESLQLLKTLAPTATTFAILSDESETGRSHVKAIEFLASHDQLPLKLVESVMTSEFEVWKTKALQLQENVDAFFIAQYSALKDEGAKYVPPEEAAGWYLRHIHIPEATNQEQFVKQGMLCGADDSAYNQGYEAVLVAHDLLTTKTKPADYAPRAPKRGALMANQQRAAMLGIQLGPKTGIEQIFEEAPVLKDQDGTKQ